jgi:hypothetical protein
MIREIHIGENLETPDGAFLIDIPAVHLRNHLYDSMNDYAESSQKPLIFIPDTRILTPDSIRQFVSFLRIHSYVSVIACARREEDVPYLFKYILTPKFYTHTNSTLLTHSIALEITDNKKFVELVSELTDLGFFTSPNRMYSRVMN